jgi:hypothetical protein
MSLALLLIATFIWGLGRGRSGGDGVHIHMEGGDIVYQAVPGEVPLGAPKAPAPGGLDTTSKRSARLGLSDASFVVVDDPTATSHLPKGTVCFVECTFKDCEFQNFNAVGSREQIDTLRALFPLHAPVQTAGSSS